MSSRTYFSAIFRLLFLLALLLRMCMFVLAMTKNIGKQKKFVLDFPRDLKPARKRERVREQIHYQQINKTHLSVVC